MGKFNVYLTPQNLIFATGVIAVISVSFALISATRRPTSSYVQPARAAIVDEVDTTGSVKAAESVDLSFDTAGRISSVYANVGSTVHAGQVLASLSGADQAAALAQTQAALQMQVAKLDGVKAGTRPEDIAVSQASVSGAQAFLASAQQSVSAAALDAYVKADDAIHNRADQFISNPRSSQPTLSVTFTDSNLQTAAQNGRVSMETLLSTWKSYLDALPSADLIVSTDVASKTRQNISSVSNYLDTVAAGLSNLTPSAYLTVTTIQKYQTDIATARSNMSAALTAMNQAETTQKSAESGLTSARSQLSLKQAGATQSDVAAQEAQVAAAQANVQAAQAQIAKTVIRSPIAGIVSKNDAHTGATATPGIPLISIISTSKFEIEAYVSEADLAKAKTGSEAQVALDAYPGAVFEAAIVTVDPAATVINGIPAYKVTMQFSQDDPRIQAGLTGNIRILAGQKDNALTIPTSAIITRGTDYFVLISSGRSDQLQRVTIGVQSADGKTEILSGLDESSMIRSFGNQ